MKITIREKLLIIVAFVLIVFLLFTNLFYKPLREKIDSLNAELNTSSNFLTSLRLQQEDLNEISAILLDTEKGYIEAAGSFPEKWDDSSVITYIENIIGTVEQEGGEGCRLYRNSLVFNGVQTYQDYVSGTYVMSITGGYDDFYRLLRRFDNYEEKNEYFNTVSSVSVSKYSEENDEITASITITFYALSL